MTTIQQAKSQVLLSLHHDNHFLVLPNIWNPIGAKLLAAKGFPAVATASAAISASLGYADGERISFATLLDLLRRIVESVDVPVTADIETGFAESLPSLKENMQQVIETGVVGINIEDSLVEGGPLRSIDEQCTRIAAIRETSTQCGLHLVINARVDSFLSDRFTSDTDKRKEAVIRAQHYVQAGADCIYPIGPGNRDTVQYFRDQMNCPINVLASAGAISLTELQALGINRVSFGPYVFRACLGRLSSILDELSNQNSSVCFTSEALASADIEPYLNKGKEV